MSWASNGFTFQTLLMAASILGPATVVLIVQGALFYVFSIPVAWSMVIAITPVIYFTVICYTSSEDFQIKAARILTLVYGLLMMAVLVGVFAKLATSVSTEGSWHHTKLVYIILERSRSCSVCELWKFRSLRLQTNLLSCEYICGIAMLPSDLTISDQSPNIRCITITAGK